MREKGALRAREGKECFKFPNEKSVTFLEIMAQLNSGKWHFAAGRGMNWACVYTFAPVAKRCFI